MNESGEGTFALCSVQSGDVGQTTSAEESPSIEMLHDEQHFIDDISQFFNQLRLSDVTIRVADLRFYGHKFILAKSSEVFRTMLYDQNWSAQSVDEIQLSESPESVAAFDKFLQFLYTAKIAMTQEHAIGVLCLADKYNVVSLRKLCIDYMVDHARAPHVDQALEWYAWAKALNLQELLDQCMKTIAWNVADIITSQYWATMDLEFVKDVLSSDDLVVPSEYTLYESVSSWLLSDSHVTGLTHNAQELLPLVRFPQMVVAQLYQIEDSELAHKSETSLLLRELLGKAYRFRSLCPPLSGLESVTFQESFFLPRDYRDLAVDTVQIHNTMRFGMQVDVRMYVGPVPSHNRDGDWKITYRKSNNTWQLQVYGLETAMISSEAKFQLTAVIYDTSSKVIQVEKTPAFVCTRTNPLNHSVHIAEIDTSDEMQILIKPLP